MDNSKIVDVKGVVLNVEGMNEITMKNGISKPIRRILIADNSKEPGLSIQVTFWGIIAYKADFNQGEIVALKDAKVGTYNAVSLNMSDECEMKKLKSDKVLSEWYKNLKSTKDIVPLSEQNKNQFQNKEAGLQPQLISEILEKVQEDIEQDTTPNYVIECYLTFIAKADNMIYMACPEDKKKVQKEFGKGEWYCERCNKYYDKPVATYMVTAKLSDATGALFVSFYAEQAEQLFNGFTAEEFSHIQIHGTEDEVRDKINDFLYKPIRVLVKARQNDFGHEMGNIKYFGQKVYPYKYNAHNLNIINTLKEYKPK
jgi:replication factor A1